jgi:hypothetical protein
MIRKPPTIDDDLLCGRGDGHRVTILDKDRMRFYKGEKEEIDGKPWRERCQ